MQRSMLRMFGIGSQQESRGTFCQHGPRRLASRGVPEKSGSAVWHSLRTNNDDASTIGDGGEGLSFVEFGEVPAAPSMLVVVRACLPLDR